MPTLHKRNFCVVTGVPNISLPMYSFNISTDEHVTLKFVAEKRLIEIT